MERICYVTYRSRSDIKTAFAEDTPLWRIAKDIGAEQAICALAGGRIVSLSDVPEDGAHIRFLKPTEHEQASRVFMRGLTFVLYRAARELFPSRQLLIDHMLCGGAYCELGQLTREDIRALQERVDALIEQDEDFVLHLMRVDEAKKIMIEEGLHRKAALLAFRPFDYYRLYTYGGLHNYFHGVMPKSAGYLKGAHIYAYADGLIMKYPTPYTEAHTSIVSQPKYGEVFRQAERWAKELSASYVADINNMFRNGSINDFISINEALHERTIAEIAQTIAAKSEVRLVLVAGPSSSGKTTFSNRLAVHLKALGKRCRPISVDDYYKDQGEHPLDEDGLPDFEGIESIDTAKLGEDLTLLLEGREAQMPVYDFVAGRRRPQLVPLRIDDDILIIEGLHGLNDALTHSIDARYKFKIFISPLTTLNIDSHSVVMPEDLRLLRRLVRDKRTRGYSFAQTFAIWNKVRRGEYKYILPYQETADVMFNSTLLYEPLILKKYAYSDLRRFTPEMPNYVEALGLLKFLNYFLSLGEESAVPPMSILREFIGR